jgi:hypothetical protein
VQWSAPRTGQLRTACVRVEGLVDALPLHRRSVHGVVHMSCRGPFVPTGSSAQFQHEQAASPEPHAGSHGTRSRHSRGTVRDGDRDRDRDRDSDGDRDGDRDGGAGRGAGRGAGNAAGGRPSIGGATVTGTTVPGRTGAGRRCTGGTGTGRARSGGTGSSHRTVGPWTGGPRCSGPQRQSRRTVARGVASRRVRGNPPGDGLRLPAGRG